METRNRRTPDQIAQFTKDVKKAVGRGAAGKKFTEIKAKLAENLGVDAGSLIDAHVRKALVDLCTAGDLTSAGATRSCTYSANAG